MTARTVALVALLVGVTALGLGPAVADETASIDEESLPLEAGQQQVLLGQTSLAQGTELTVRLQSSHPVPYLRQQTAYVDENGTFAVVFDMSTIEANSSFDLTVLHDGTTLVERTETVAACEGNCTDTVPEMPEPPDDAGVVSVERGGVATIPVSTNGSDTVAFSFGSAESNYRINATLSDGNDDGEVRLRFDTAAAGTDETTLSVADTADSITITRDEPALDSTLDPADYQYRVYHAGDTVPTATGRLVVESNESASEEFDVSDDEPGFEQNIYVGRQGDVVAVNLTLDDEAPVMVSIGGPDNGYQINATVTDGNGDGTVSLLFDTGAAGRSGETLRAAAAGDSVTIVPGSEVDRDTYIDAGAYDLDFYGGADSDDAATDIATLSLQEGNVSSATETPLSVTEQTGAGGNPTEPSPAGIGALAVGGLLAVGGVAIVFRTLLP